MINWELTEDIIVVSLKPRHAGEVHQLMATNRTHLDRWLRWSAAIQTQTDVLRMIELFQQQWENGNGFYCGIWYRGELAGGIVCWYIHPENKNAEIGYWLGEAFTGKGLASRATARCITYLFEEAGLHRVEMQCGVENVKSRAIPERLEFTLEGIRRDSHWITDRFVDHAVYGLLAHEWTYADD